MSRVVPTLDTQDFYTGDTQILYMTLTDNAGDAIDVSGGSFDCQIRTEKNDTVVVDSQTLVATVAVSFTTDGTDGMVTLTLTSAEAEKMRPYRRLYWDLEFEESGRVITLWKGQISVDRDVSE